ncbi:hypothetical protein PsYK624_109990 [Phanerochaete sordida]|uniref:Uncharacterized protein n=1 Tax=Phanerochaete sordida TaxID=48140 RepID=A0A9P3LHM8_9APHY|nr:hypothetical protein PsYK624_109990 [Phanerochaete sordida]
MARHLQQPDLLTKLSSLEPRKYQAIFSSYLEEPSVDKPWHLCELWIMHEILPVAAENEHADQPPEPVASIVPPDLSQALLETFPPSTEKSTYLFQSIFARIRTRPCEVPRATPNLFLTDHDQWRSVQSLLERTTDYTENIRSVECRRCFVKRTQDPATQPTKRLDNSAAPPWGESEQPALYLLPHFEYSFDLEQNVSLGKYWEEEHAEIVSLLRAAVPAIPEHGRVPLMWIGDTREEDRSHYVEHPRSESPATEQRKVYIRMHRDAASSVELPLPSTLAQWTQSLLSCVPRRTSRVPAPLVPEYTERVDQPEDSFFVQASASPERRVPVVVPARRFSRSLSPLHLFSRGRKPSVDRPFMPFVDSYKVEKKIERRDRSLSF